ncbi:hypothetical protein L873DRAFT_1807203 [Choiromyces venosus 120613-1]|uniref:ABC transporter domain-containing protein n=1 Tax=Choiromyces venosus 120613-1 TaxID=1336337 RepID=A0A3N4JPS0_9PEZI|nr:hypothetical protein L873DRAFT_1807203 [Choiromyces venosus 120613-1]
MPLSDTAIFDYLSAVFSADSSQGSLDAALALCTAILSDPARAHHSFPTLFPPLSKAAADKKSGTRRESAMIVYGALYESFIPKSSVTEILLLKDTLHIVLDGLADKGAVVREASQYAIDAMFSLLKEEALVVGLVRVLMAYLKSSGAKWQGRVAALQLIGKVAEKAVTKDGFLKEVMGRELEALIPIVEGGMHDLKSEVSRAAVKAMTSLSKLLSNDDIARHIPTLIKTMSDPSKETLQKAIHDLSQTTFIAIVTSPVLSLLTPLLERSLSSPQTSQDVLRQTVVVVENLTKLVHDPVEAREFLPRLQPGVKKIEDTAALPVVRSLAKDANATMVKAMKVGTGADVPERISVDEVENELIARVTNDTDDKKRLWEQDGLRRYIAEMVRECIVAREFKRIPGCTTIYLEHFISRDNAKRVAAEIERWARDETLKRFGDGIEEVDDEHKHEVEIVNADFSLAYGGMMLLTHTNLKLYQGHRYGLCGRNGAGKSTLMRSISQGKLEGFPSKDELRTCFVEHKERDERDMSIVEYVRLALEENGDENISEKEIVETLKSVGFDGERAEMNIGQLSGGWKMKLGLAEAMLKRAQVLLLDEPTNHLDVGNVKWLQDYLKSHTEITSLIVSHDSKFLDEVCTDIIHYEDKKLVYYKGNLSEFVKKQPEGKAYYSLDASSVSFKFPSPGLLTGVKSATRSIIKMTNVTYTYPTAIKPSLYNVTASLSLSSRVAIIGGNGAGKSTLVKLLTGEMVPQEGRVEKHPNLRVGYMAQQSLHHVQMNLEKTPSQYLQWRYSSGTDKEVAMKDTRLLSEADKKQLETPIDLGDGRGPRRIEALVGRQKWKKSFQYETKWANLMPKFNTMISRETLVEKGFSKLVQDFDDAESAREGLGYRELDVASIEKHFEDIGLDKEIAMNNEIGGLSGGQKVKVVIAAAMWPKPHLLILDEPTNYLDRESLGALATAIKEFRGGVCLISHDAQFVSQLSNEEWHIDAGRMVKRTSNGSNMSLSLPVDLNSRPGSSAASLASSVVSSAANTDVEDNNGVGMEFKSVKKGKKKKYTRAQLKEREVRRRLRYLEWLNSPKGTPKPVDTDDES